MHAELRAADPGDVAEVLDFWRESALPTTTDSADALRALLDRDPGALILAEHRGAVVGSVIVGWDGWRGAIYRLAVDPAYRRQGLGRRLLGAAETRLAALGARRMHAVVVGTDARAVAFWEASDWEHQDGHLRFAK